MGLKELLEVQEKLKSKNISPETIAPPIFYAQLDLPKEMEIVVKKSSVILDNSMFSSYDTCARLFDFTFNMQLIDIDGKSNSLEAGSLVHVILEIFYTNLINGFSRTLSVAAGMAAGEEYYHGCLDCKKSTSEKFLCLRHKKSDPYLGCNNIPLDSDKYVVGYNWIVKTMEQYFDHYMADPYTPIESENVKGKVIYEDDELRIMWKAKIDTLIDTHQLNKPISMDHKTRKIDRKMTSINNQFIGQCVVTGTNNMIVNKIGFQQSLKPEDKFKREMMSYSYDRLNEWRNVVVPSTVYRFLQSIERNEWLPTFTSCETKYGFCDFVPVCSLDRSLREGKLKEMFKVGPKWDPSNE